jgi:ligand-binding sensor domain-containing protein/signal transduction histidine kinase
MRTKYFLICSLILFLLVTACSSDIPFTTPTNTIAPPATSSKEVPPSEYPVPDINGVLRFERLGLEEGLSQSVVNAITQDQFGFLWFGTTDGLNRYDGHSFEVFQPDPDDPTSITDRWITALLTDSQGNIWIGTFRGGLNRYDQSTGQFISYINDPTKQITLASNHITALLEDKDGFLWVGTSKGLERINLQTGETRRFRSIPGEQNSLPGNWVTALFEDSRGLIWVGTGNNGLSSINASDFSFRTYVYEKENPNGLASNSIYDIEEDHQGYLWVATPEGVNRISPDRNIFIHYNHDDSNPNSIIDDYVHTLYVDQAGILWLGTENGLDRYDFNAYRFIHYQHNRGETTSLSSNAIYTIHEDRGGVLWIGTYGGGLNKYNRGQSKFTYFNSDQTKENSLSSNFVFPIVVAKDGTVWVGTYGGGLNHFNPRTGLYTHYHNDPANPRSLVSDVVISAYIDNNETLWVGTNRGLSRFDAQNGIFINYTASLEEPEQVEPQPGKSEENIVPGAVHAIFEDSRGILWVGAANGLYQFRQETEIFIPFKTDTNQPDSQNSNHITAIFEDSDQNLWFGTSDNGVSRYDPIELTYTSFFSEPQHTGALSHNSVLAIYQDSRGILWIATAGGGLNRYHPESDAFTSITEKNGLPNNVVYGILEDYSGYLWLTTNRGLSRYNPATGTFRNYTTKDGLQSIEFNQNAYAKGQDGKLYVGGINGFNIFDPAEVKDSNYAPPVVLTSFTQGSQPLSDQSGLEQLRNVTLTWPDNNFSFEFSILGYASPSQNLYAYMLENFDSDWNYIGSRREGRYTNLPGGTYVLRLKGSNNDGVWNQYGQSISITVVPPFWETWTFRILAVLATIGLIAGAYTIRVRSIRLQNLHLEQIVRERTSALQKRTTEMEALYSGDEKIIRSVTLDQVFQAIVEVAVQMLHADRSVVFVWNEKYKKVMPRVSHGFAPETLAVLKFAKGEGVVGRVLETGEPITAADLDLDTLRPDVRAAIVAEGIHSFVHLPINVDGQIIGVFNVGFTRPEAIVEDTVRLFTALVQRAALSIENMQLFEKTKELAVIEERNRVARDLHDSAKQKAFAALAQLGAVSGILKTDPSHAWSHLGEAENLVYEVIQELTFLIQEMYPMALKEKGLATTLREYVFEWENRNGVMINLVIQNARRMPLEMEQAMYRMIQESLANVARHSQADKVDVSLIYNPDNIELTVEDNGLGFNSNNRSGGMGLRIIKERAETIGGHAYVESAPGLGTKIMITAPLNGHID